MNILKIKTSNRKKGDIGENAAAKHLKKKGYKILERNFVALDGEIDIIAANSEYYVFCEVKARTENIGDYTSYRPAAAVNCEKQKKIINIAKYYLATKNDGRKIRFDVIEVILDKEDKVKDICHMEAAFNLNTAYRR